MGLINYKWTQVGAYSMSKSLLYHELIEHTSEHKQSDTLQKTNKKSKKFGPYEYEFDDSGYLSVDDLVKFLQYEAAFDICVIQTTGAQRAYVDYFVVVSGVSNRHIHAISKNLEQLFRGEDVRGVGKHGHVTVEGLSSDNWLALDIGNIAIHFFLPETREVYELEKLWTLGPKYDDKYKALLDDEEFLKAMFVGEERQSQDEGDN
ncbi:hypothetical protein QZH41_015275 [Actinostola sp. cb2023]|nr:hypothetical protein QZH41_015275 [Actinostola sp. cb2023]